MMAFRDGSRGNNPGMSDLMKATPTDDLAALSQYLAGLQIDQYLGQRPLTLKAPLRASRAAP